MEGLSGPQEAGAWRFRRLALAAALLVALFAAVLLSSVPPGGQARGHRDRHGRRQPGNGGRLSEARRGLSSLGRRRAGLDPVRPRRHPRGAVQPAAGHLVRRRARAHRTPATSCCSSPCSPAAAGVVDLPAGPAAGDRSRAGWCWTGSSWAGRSCSSPASSCSRGSSTKRWRQRVRPARSRRRRGHRDRGHPAVPARRRRRTGLRSGWLRSGSSATPVSDFAYARAAPSGPPRTTSARSPTSAGSSATRCSRWPCTVRAARRRRTASGRSSGRRWPARLVMFTLFLGATVFSLLQPDQDGMTTGAPTATWLASRCCSRSCPARSC